MKLCFLSEETKFSLECNERALFNNNNNVKV